MPSPLAHIGVSIAVSALVTPLRCRDVSFLRQPYLWVAFAAIAPDLDVLPMLWSPSGLQWHRGPSHSLLGAALIGLLCSLFLEKRARIATVLAGLFHVVMDWSTGIAPTPIKYGVPLFWPFSSQKYTAEQPYFGAFGIDKAGGLYEMLSAEALSIYGKELLTVVLSFAGVWLLKTLLRRVPS
jgi:membrane-bound metal-dependent hydrolase YbcI (DUF457 family)